jgi:hypothetical protein
MTIDNANDAGKVLEFRRAEPEQPTRAQELAALATAYYQLQQLPTSCCDSCQRPLDPDVDAGRYRHAACRPPQLPPLVRVQLAELRRRGGG